MPRQNKTPCNTYGKFHGGLCRLDSVRCYGCGEMGHMVSECPKAEWNGGKNVQGTRTRNPQLTASKADLLLPAQYNEIGILGNLKLEVESTS